jgi:hypothetical protein
MTDTVTANGYDATGGLDPPVTRPRVVKDPTAASRARRYRDNKRKAAGASRATTAKVNDFKSRVTVTRDDGVAVKDPSKPVAVTPFVRPPDQIRWHTVTAYVAALGLATVSAGFSITGLTAVFTGAFWPVIGMGAALELGKLSAVAWLGRRECSRALRGALTALVAVLMGLNAAGCYGFLARAHIASSVAGETAVAGRAADVEARIRVQEGVMADLDRRLGQIDKAVETATVRGRTSGAMQLAGDQRRNRAELVAERLHVAKGLASLQVEKASIEGERRTVEADLGPVFHSHGRAVARSGGGLAVTCSGVGEVSVGRQGGVSRGRFLFARVPVLFAAVQQRFCSKFAVRRSLVGRVVDLRV